MMMQRNNAAPELFCLSNSLHSRATDVLGFYMLCCLLGETILSLLEDRDFFFPIISYSVDLFIGKRGSPLCFWFRSEIQGNAVFLSFEIYYSRDRQLAKINNHVSLKYSYSK